MVLARTRRPTEAEPALAAIQKARTRRGVLLVMGTMVAMVLVLLCVWLVAQDAPILR